MHVILVHGLGRTPLSLLLLGRRLRAAGLKPRLFGYLPAVESFGHCADRLVATVGETAGARPYALAGHSLGAVLIRAVLPRLQENPPAACFLLAPPNQACRAARYFARYRLYKLLAGEMGQKLADPAFMDALPVPYMPTRIYAGTGGFSGRCSPFGGEPNDGILTLAETRGALAAPLILTPASHTFIMNARLVADDIARTLAALPPTA
jgi:hypothetical protein